MAERVDICPPCGGCRQRLSEFARPTRRVHLGRPGGPRRTVTLGELLPLAFGAEALAERRPDEAASAAATAPAAARRHRARLGPRRGWRTRSRTRRDPLRRAARLPGRPTSRATPGRLVLGTLGGVPVAVLQGRAHLYEAPGAETSHSRSATLAPLGAETSCSPTPPARCAPRSAPGSLMAITDHINLTGVQPARRPQRRRARPPLPEPERRLRPRAARAAARRRRSARASTLPTASTSPCRPELRDAGRDPRVPDARRRRRRHVDRPEIDRRPPLRPARRGGLGDHQPRRGPGRRGAQPRADAARRRNAPRGDLGECSPRFVGRLA